MTSDAVLHLSELQFPHLGSKGLELLLQKLKILLHFTRKRQLIFTELLLRLSLLLCVFA